MNIEDGGVAAGYEGHLRLVCQGFVSEVWLTWHMGAGVSVNVCRHILRCYRCFIVAPVNKTMGGFVLIRNLCSIRE